MAGYNGFSMSNNAVEAYENGEKPFSKWTKGEIIDNIISVKLELKCSISVLKKIPASNFKNMFLRKTSWHHTSSRFNKTDFYSIDYTALEQITDDKIEAIVLNLKKIKEEDEKKKEVDEIWRCKFLEWSGTRKHPKATEVIEEGIVKGDWFIRKDGSKKKTSANGFEKLERIS